MLIGMSRLHEGGDAVARMAGGRLLPSRSLDLAERRLLNVMEEMALASGIACPKVYILEAKRSINAFAAGHRHDEATIAVTRGALQRLDRDEPQGVVAHEFSHIPNGDMLLNLRLLAVVYGLQVVAGFGRTIVWNSRTSGRSGRAKVPISRFIFLLGIALCVIGSLGVFFGRMIKAAVSHQREYLADASAVQFTRSRDGIGGALRKIGGLAEAGEHGSLIRHPNAEHLSHLFLAEAVKPMFARLFLNHPPLVDRLRRMYGKRVQFVMASQIMPSADAPAPRLPDTPFTPMSDFISPQSAPDAEANEKGDQDALTVEMLFPFALLEAARSPAAVGAVVCALVMDPAQAAVHLAILTERLPQHARLAASFCRTFAGLPRHARMPLLDLAGPALQLVTQTDRTHLIAAVNALVAADQHVTFQEFVLQIVLERRLMHHAKKLTPIRYLHLTERKADVAAVLSLIAHVASINRADATTRADAARKAFNRGPESIRDVGLAPADLAPPGAISLASLRTALAHLDQLAPLVKPALVKALLAAGTEGALSGEMADVLCAVCARIDMPRPPAINAAYPEMPSLLRMSVNG